MKQGTVMEFKVKTLNCFHPLDEQEPERIEEIVTNYINSIIAEYEIDAEIVELAITGSRARGIEKLSSDLDIAVELNSYEKEDYLFNVLNQPGLFIAGIKVDINPITRYQTGTLEEYLIAAEKYLEERIKEMNKGYELYNAVKERKHGR